MARKPVGRPLTCTVVKVDKMDFKRSALKLVGHLDSTLLSIDLVYEMKRGLRTKEEFVDAVLLSLANKNQVTREYSKNIMGQDGKYTLAMDEDLYNVVFAYITHSVVYQLADMHYQGGIRNNEDREDLTALIVLTSMVKTREGLVSEDPVLSKSCIAVAINSIFDPTKIKDDNDRRQLKDVLEASHKNSGMIGSSAE